MSIVYGILAGIIIVIWFLFLEFQKEIMSYLNLDIDILPNWMIIEEKEKKSKKISFNSEYNFDFSPKKDEYKKCGTCGTKLTPKAIRCIVCGTFFDENKEKNDGIWNK